MLEFSFSRVEKKMALTLLQKIHKDIFLMWPEKTFNIEITEWKPLGSYSQKKKIFSLAGQIAKETGNDKYSIVRYVIDDLNKHAIWPCEEVNGVEIPLSVKKCNTEALGWLIEGIYKLAAELNITLREI